MLKLSALSSSQTKAVLHNPLQSARVHFSGALPTKGNNYRWVKGTNVVKQSESKHTPDDSRELDFQKKDSFLWRNRWIAGGIAASALGATFVGLRSNLKSRNFAWLLPKAKPVELTELDQIKAFLLKNRGSIVGAGVSGFGATFLGGRWAYNRFNQIVTPEPIVNKMSDYLNSSQHMRFVNQTLPVLVTGVNGWLGYRFYTQTRDGISDFLSGFTKQVHSLNHKGLGNAVKKTVRLPFELAQVCRASLMTSKDIAR